MKITINEEFRPLTYPGIRKDLYLVGEFGTIYNKQTKKELKPFIVKKSNTKYYRCGLAGINKSQTIKVYVHRLVAWEFCEGYDDSIGRTFVNHKNGIGTDNYYANLEWVTISENTIHAHHSGIYYNKQRKFTYQDVVKICKMFEKGYTPGEVCNKMFGSCYLFKKEYDIIYKIYSRKSYTEVSQKYKF